MLDNDISIDLDDLTGFTDMPQNTRPYTTLVAGNGTSPILAPVASPRLFLSRMLTSEQETLETSSGVPTPCDTTALPPTPKQARFIQMT